MPDIKTFPEFDYQGQHYIVATDGGVEVRQSDGTLKNISPSDDLRAKAAEVLAAARAGNWPPPASASTAAPASRAAQSASPYQRSIDQAARVYGAAADAYNVIKQQLDKLQQADPSGDTTGAQQKSLSDQLGDAQKRFNTSEQAYQDAVEAADKSAATAKEFLPAGTTRNRLDTTAGNVLVSVTETADGRGGWSTDPSSVKRVDVGGAGAGGTRVTTPTSDKFIVTMDDSGALTQKENPNYQPDKNAGPTAVPSSEFIYQDGAVKPNPAYRGAPAEINTSARQINDPAHPGQLVDNPNYRAPDATVSTTAEYIPDPASPGKFVKNPNYQSPADRLTPGQSAVDTATAGTAGDVAQANLSKAQADSAKAQQDLEDARRASRQAPTDQQAQHAIDTAQQRLDVSLQAEQAALAQLKTINPVAAKQAQATLDQTTQNTQKAKLGDQYGLQDRIQQVRDLIALGPKNGGISPEDGDAMIAATTRGTTVYDAMKQQNTDASNARTQDTSNLNSLAGNFASMANSGLGTFQDMNKTGAIGSDATGKAYLGMLTLAQNELQQYRLPAVAPTSYLNGPPSPVGGMVDTAQKQLAQPAAPIGPPPPATAPTHVQPITINIGGGSQPDASPTPAPAPYSYTPETSAQSQVRNQVAMGTGDNNNVNSLVGSAARSVPASMQDVVAANPNAARRAGYQV